MIKIRIEAAHEKVNPLALLNYVKRMDEKRIEGAGLAIIIYLGSILVPLEVLLDLEEIYKINNN